MNEKKRDDTVDIFRGIAILLVVMGHTLSGSTKDYQNTFLFNIIWTLQMPLFMMISGYVTKYSKKIDSGHSLVNYIKKRSIAYLMPWFVWTILVRGLIFAHHNFIDLRYLLWHMDSGYWFLTSLWTICIVFGLAQYLSGKFVGKNENIKNETIKNIICTAAFCICGGIVLIILGRLLGMTFFGIKLTVYYIPFFLLGYLYSQCEKLWDSQCWYSKIKEGVIAASFFIYFILLTRFHFYDISDQLIGIILRMTASVTGCISVFGLGTGLLNRTVTVRGGGKN